MLSIVYLLTEFARIAVEIVFYRSVIVFLLLTNLLSIAVAFGLVHWERQGKLRERIARRLEKIG